MATRNLFIVVGWLLAAWVVDAAPADADRSSPDSCSVPRASSILHGLPTSKAVPFCSSLLFSKTPQSTATCTRTVETKVKTCSEKTKEKTVRETKTRLAAYVCDWSPSPLLPANWTATAPPTT